MPDANTCKDFPAQKGFLGLLNRRPWTFALVFLIAGAVIVRLATMPFGETIPYGLGLSPIEIDLLVYMAPMTAPAAILLIAEARDPSRMENSQGEEE